MAGRAGLCSLLACRATQHHPLSWTGEGGWKEGTARAVLLNAGLGLAKAPAKQQAGADVGAPISLLRAKQTVSSGGNPTKAPPPQLGDFLASRFLLALGL